MQNSVTAAEAPLMRYAFRVREIESDVRRKLPHLLSFDSCLNVAAALDHLFTDIIAEILFVCMMSLSADDRREDVEQILLSNAYGKNYHTTADS